MERSNVGWTITVRSQSGRDDASLVEIWYVAESDQQRALARVKSLTGARLDAAMHVHALETTLAKAIELKAGQVRCFRG